MSVNSAAPMRPGCFVKQATEPREAAALPSAAVTAWNALTTDGALRPGATVLTFGSGAVSPFVPQSPLPYAFHSDRLFVDQSGGALVWVLDRPNNPPRGSQERSIAGETDPRLDRRLERQPSAVRVEEDRGRDPRHPRPVYAADFRRRTPVPARCQDARPSPAIRAAVSPQVEPCCIAQKYSSTTEQRLSPSVTLFRRSCGDP